eukprot:3111324-Prymnesium_polylepis.1
MVMPCGHNSPWHHAHHPHNDDTSALPAPAARVHGKPQTCSEATSDLLVAHSMSCCVPPCSWTARVAESCARHAPLVTVGNVRQRSEATPTVHQHG